MGGSRNTGEPANAVDGGIIDRLRYSLQGFQHLRGGGVKWASDRMQRVLQRARAVYLATTRLNCKSGV